MSAKERRKPGRSLTDAVNMLNAVQSHSLGEYLDHGGNLAFVRQTDEGNIAVCCNGPDVVTIDEYGVIDHHPNIDMREQ